MVFYFSVLFSITSLLYNSQSLFFDFYRFIVEVCNSADQHHRLSLNHGHIQRRQSLNDPKKDTWTQSIFNILWISSNSIYISRAHSKFCKQVQLIGIQTSIWARRLTRFVGLSVKISYKGERTNFSIFLFSILVPLVNALSFF